MTATSPSSSARLERQERARTRMRERICAAAMELFLHEGFERTSIRRIAAAIGYTPGAIYSYFGDKDDILYALHEQGFARLRVLLQTLDGCGLGARERFERVGELYLRFAFENPQYYDLMFIKDRTAKKIEELGEWEVGLDTYDFVRTIVRECMRDGVLPQGDVEAATFALWASVHGMASLVIRSRCKMIPPDALPTVVAEAYRWTMRAMPAPEPAHPPRARGCVRKSGQ